MTRRISSVALSSALVWGVLAGCSSGTGQAEASGTTGSLVPDLIASKTPVATSTPVTSPTPHGARAPLTGLAAEASSARRAAVLVVVSGRNPEGLAVADLVLEEASLPTRYLAVFQSRDAPKVGPVAPPRLSDTLALGVLKPIYAHAGGSPTARKLVKVSKAVVDAGVEIMPTAYDGSGAQVMASTPALRAIRPGLPAPPEALTFADGPPPPGGAAQVTQLEVRGNGRSAQTWLLRDGSWVRTAGGPNVTVANLVLQTVSYKTIRVNKQPVPSVRPLGRGASIVMTGGRRTAGSWSKPSADSVCNYVDGRGVPVRLVPGRTWVLLLSPGDRVDTR
jgi:hypothetical protein